ncbi:hypothetical protein ACFLYN_02810 [Chloroflexota bacterium]
MRNTLCRLCLITTILITGFTFSPTKSARADGGPILTDPELWGMLEEGQQTAVITLRNDKTADVDLFVTMLDRSGESHEVIFFVPLGIDAANFNVTEKMSYKFDQDLTEKLDKALRNEVYQKRHISLYMLLPSTVINGGWMLAVYLPGLLSGCSYAGEPEASYETESSRVDIYGLDENTNLDILIHTTGLDESVRDTLSRLRGQRIAVVTLQTQPPPSEGEGSGGGLGQPGIHLSWTTALDPQSDTAVYSYPLGTGLAWAHPIEMTRVYVVAPRGLDFTVDYPELGEKHSGFTKEVFGLPRPNIIRYHDTPAYAIDEGQNDSDRIWRATYTQSNSAEDITVNVGSSDGFLASLRRTFVSWGVIPNLIIGLLIALITWVAAWRYIMPRMAGIEYKWKSRALWRDSLIYPAINAILLSGAASIIVIFYLIPSESSAHWIITLVLLIIIIGIPVLFAVPGVIYLLKKGWLKFDVTRNRAQLAFFIVIVVSNLSYLLLAFGYSALIGVL